MVEVGGFGQRNLPSLEGHIEKKEVVEEKPLLSRDSFHTEWDTEAYLKVCL